MDFDGSLETLEAHTTTGQPAILSAHHYGGVQKKSKKGPISRHKRLRQEKGRRKAEAVLDRLERKVERGFRRGHAIKERRVGWDRAWFTERSRC
jgi:hypothetical protein